MSMRYSLGSEQKRKNGFTLIEAILAITILAIVVILMAPVLLRGFRQIVLSGDRSRTGKEAVAAIEGDLASGFIPISNPTQSIPIGDGVSVNVYLVRKSITGNLGTVEIDTYIPPTMQLDTPLAQEISFDGVALDISTWTLTNPVIRIKNTTDKMEYSIVQGLSPIPLYVSCSNGNTNITLSSPQNAYRVEIRQIDNQLNKIHLDIRKAPQVRLVRTGDNLYFQIDRNGTGEWFQVTSTDHIQYKWNLYAWLIINDDVFLPSSLKNSKDTIYVRYSDGTDIININRDDPPSLYVRIDIP